MRRSNWLLGAVISGLFLVGCGPLDPEELSQQDEALKATPILFGASCPAANACGSDFVRCTEWSEPSSCGGSSSNATVRFQMCFDANGNGCLQSSVTPATAG